MAPKASLKIPVLYPTMDDINRPFEEFIAKHEKRIGAVGLAKIVPPAGWSPRPAGCRSYEELPDVTIERCIKQVATGSKGLYRFLLVEQKPMRWAHRNVYLPGCMIYGAMQTVHLTVAYSSLSVIHGDAVAT